MTQSVAAPLANKVALVTGSARGIGRATAQKLAEQGARVVLSDLDEDALEETAGAIAGSLAVAGDLTEPSFPDALVARCLKEFQRLDIMVNNAGYVWNSAIHNHTDAQFDAMLDIHATAPFRLLRAYGRWMRETGPGQQCRKVVNVSSVSATHGAATQLAYSAGKAALLGITRTLAKEWGRFNVTVNAIAFGPIDTRLTQAFEDAPPSIEVAGQAYRVGLSARQLDELRNAIPLGRIGTPTDAANGIYLLCAPESDFITGEVLICSGGLRS